LRTTSTCKSDGAGSDKERDGWFLDAGIETQLRWLHSGLSLRGEYRFTRLGDHRRLDLRDTCRIVEVTPSGRRDLHSPARQVSGPGPPTVPVASLRGDLLCPPLLLRQVLPLLSGGLPHFFGPVLHPEPNCQVLDAQVLYPLSLPGWKTINQYQGDLPVI